MRRYFCQRTILPRFLYPSPYSACCFYVNFSEQTIFIIIEGVERTISSWEKELNSSYKQGEKKEERRKIITYCYNCVRVPCPLFFNGDIAIISTLCPFLLRQVGESYPYRLLGKTLSSTNAANASDPNNALRNANYNMIPLKYTSESIHKNLPT